MSTVLIVFGNQGLLFPIKFWAEVLLHVIFPAVYLCRVESSRYFSSIKGCVRNWKDTQSGVREGYILLQLLKAYCQINDPKPDPGIYESLFV